MSCSVSMFQMRLDQWKWLICSVISTCSVNLLNIRTNNHCVQYITAHITHICQKSIIVFSTSLHTSNNFFNLQTFGCSQFWEHEIPTHQKHNKFHHKFSKYWCWTFCCCYNLMQWRFMWRATILNNNNNNNNNNNKKNKLQMW